MSLIRIDGWLIPPLPPPNTLEKGSLWDCFNRCKRCGSRSFAHECIADVRDSARQMLTETSAAGFATEHRIDIVVNHYLNEKRLPEDIARAQEI